jgi:hypothetical protein
MAEQSFRHGAAADVTSADEKKGLHSISGGMFGQCHRIVNQE